MNSKEQIIAEKLKSLLRIGTVSTRYKDIYDIFYLVRYNNISEAKLNEFVSQLIFECPIMRENDWNSINGRLNQILNDKRFIENTARSSKGWITSPVAEVMNAILQFFSKFS